MKTNNFLDLSSSSVRRECVKDFKGFQRNFPRVVAKYKKRKKIRSRQLPVNFLMNNNNSWKFPVEKVN